MRKIDNIDFPYWAVAESIEDWLLERQPGKAQVRRILTEVAFDCDDCSDLSLSEGLYERKEEIQS